MMLREETLDFFRARLAVIASGHSTATTGNLGGLFEVVLGMAGADAMLAFRSAFARVVECVALFPVKRAPDAEVVEATRTVSYAVGRALAHLFVAGWAGAGWQERAIVMAARGHLYGLAGILATAYPAPQQYESFAEIGGVSRGAVGAIAAYADANPFDLLAPVEIAPVSMSNEAVRVMTALRLSDPVLDPLSVVAVSAYCRSIADGVIVRG